MKPKYKIILIITLINLSIFSLCANINVKAQGTYSIGVKRDKEYIWEVTYLDSSLFSRVLGYEPNFVVGDKTRIVIKEVVDVETFWRITFYFWDYHIDWTEEVSSQTIEVYELPSNYVWELAFLPIPVDDYLEAVEEEFPTDYNVEGVKISQILKSEIDEEYVHEKTFDNNGILVKEAVYQYVPYRLIVQVDATFISVPMGIYFIGFIFLAIVIIIFINIKNRKYSFKLL